MKIKHIFWSLLLSAALVACQREDDTVHEPVMSESFTATMESFGEETRTVLDGKYAKWTSGDEIAVFHGRSAADRYVLDDLKTSTFRLVERARSEGSPLETNVAIYPYGESFGCEKTDAGYKITNISFPSVQQYQENSFAEESFLMTAVTDGLEERVLDFRNICGGLRLYITGDQSVEISTIVLSGNNNEQLAGIGSITCDSEDNLSFNGFDKSASGQITLNCGGVRLDEQTARQFIISLPPLSFTKGFTITVNAKVGGADFPYTRSTDKPHTVRRSTFLSMPSFVFGDVPEEPLLNVTPSFFTYGADGGNQIVTLSSNQDWSAESDSPWLSVIPASGTASQETASITLKATANENEDSRTAKVTFTAGELTRTVTVTQTGVEVQPVLLVNKSELEFSADGGNDTIELTSNVANWTSSKDADWLSVTPSSGESSENPVKINIKANPNDGEASRTATITFTAGDLTKTVTVTQSGKVLPPSLEVSKTSFEVTSEAASLSLEVTSNVNWTASTDSDWLSITPSFGIASDKSVSVTLTFNANETYDERTATITFTAGELIKKVTIAQLPDNALLPTNPNEFALIDLGLSVKWANYNMGADSPFGTGIATSWGYEEGQDVSLPRDMNISGSEYDIVRASLGGEWRLPTIFDFLELEQKCSWTPAVINGLRGNLITGPNGNSIFLPDAVYWTGTARERSTDDHDYLYGMYWTPEGITASADRYCRPVQGNVRVYPEAVLSVKEIGKTNAQVNATVSDLGINLDVNLIVSSEGSFQLSPTSISNGEYVFDIENLSSNYQYRLRLAIKLKEWTIMLGKNAIVHINTLNLIDGDGIEAQPVDLGLSVKWAEWNLGASCRNDRGLKLNWGGVLINDATRIDLKDTEISGTSNDPATVLWGPEWRLPTLTEWRELIGSYYRDQFSVNATGGVLLKERVFLPEDGVTQYMSSQYGYGCYFLMYAYCYAGSLPSTGSGLYVRPVYDPLPQLDILDISAITTESVLLKARVIREGGSIVTQRGFVYSTMESPTLKNAYAVQTGSDFTSSLTGLMAGTTYYVRPFAINSYGTSYGKEVSFTTEQWSPLIDYIDEYGVNHGKGVEIDGVVWAPVNCGYHSTDFKYGKLYQWGRKYGQGYEGNIYNESGNKTGTYSDAIVPTFEEGGVTEIDGNHKNNANVFYFGTLDWVDPGNDKLWNSGTEPNSLNTDYDPCPKGWRVPTSAELNELSQNYSSWTSENGQSGIWFSGASSYTAVVPQVFFPAAGYRLYRDGNASDRGYLGYYWSSRPYNDDAYSLYLRGGNVDMYSRYRAYGYSVRCVQE